MPMLLPTSEIPIPKDIVAEIQATADEKNNENDDNSDECEEPQTEPFPTCLMAYECIENIQTF